MPPFTQNTQQTKLKVGMSFISSKAATTPPQQLLIKKICIWEKTSLINKSYLRSLSAWFMPNLILKANHTKWYSTSEFQSKLWFFSLWYFIIYVYIMTQFSSRGPGALCPQTTEREAFFFLYF